jgi:hypothetical protein
MVDNPNVLLTNALATVAEQGFQVIDAVQIEVSAVSPTPPGQQPVGSIGNVPFLGPNAEVASVSATFWIEKIANASGATFLQLQYSQTVLLSFNTLSWPHVTVGTLVKAV